MYAVRSPIVWVGLALLLAVFASSLPSCDSGGGLKDENYGKDIGAGYGGPEAGFADGGTTQSDKDAQAGDDASSDAISSKSTNDTARSADANVDLGPGDATQPL